MRILTGTYALSAGYYDAYYKRAQQVLQSLFISQEKCQFCDISYGVPKTIFLTIILSVKCVKIQGIRS